MSKNFISETSIDFANKKYEEKRKKEINDLIEQDKVDEFEKERKEKNTKSEVAFSQQLNEKEYATEKYVKKILVKFSVAADRLMKLFEELLKEQNCDQDFVDETRKYIKVFSAIEKCLEENPNQLTKEQLDMVKSAIDSISCSNDLREAIRTVKSLTESLIKLVLFVNEISRALGEPVPKLEPAVDIRTNVFDADVLALNLSFVQQETLRF